MHTLFFADETAKIILCIHPQAKKKHAPHQEHADYTIVRPAKSRLEVFAMCLTGIPGSQL